MIALRLCSFLFLARLSLPAQDLAAFEKIVTEFTLANGLHFILVERHDAPVVSFHTYVNAGSVDDPSGVSGIAHMFEHMAFKGTETIGTKDWPAEKKALEAVEEIYDRLEAERAKGPKADESRAGTLQAQLKMAIDRAQVYVIPNVYPQLIEESGGVGLNAGTSLDSTEYYYSLPSNRVELWFLLESARFIHPVFREFYKERDVVMEEHRMRVESNPQGQLTQAYLASAFAAHPYRNPPGGWPSDIVNLRRADANAFFQKYYVPANMNIAIVGDVNPAEAKKMAERYFGPLAARPRPAPLHTEEPPQPGPKTSVVESDSQPVLMVGYKRPSMYDKDDPVFDIIDGILAGGRTGLLYKDLVRDKRLALQAGAGDSFPGSKYANTFLLYVVPSQGKTIEENQKALDELLERFKSTTVDAVTLQRVKTKTRAALIRRLDNNAGLANLMTTYYALYGNWRKMFTGLADLEKVTIDDVQRVAQKYFVAKSRTVVYSMPSPAKAVPAKPARAAGGAK